MKKKFSETVMGRTLKGETKVGKILKAVLQGVLDVAPIPALKYFKLDRNQDGKVTVKDFRWFELAGAVAMLAILINYEIVQPEQVVELIKLLLGGLE